MASTTSQVRPIRKRLVLPIRKRSYMKYAITTERIVWAKVTGYKHWPARIVPDSIRKSYDDYKQADEFMKDTDDTLVFFFGTSQIAWVQRKKAIVGWKEGVSSGYSRPMDFADDESEVFDAALEEATNYCFESFDPPFSNTL